MLGKELEGRTRGKDMGNNRFSKAKLEARLNPKNPFNLRDLAREWYLRARNLVLKDGIDKCSAMVGVGFEMFSNHWTVIYEHIGLPSNIFKGYETLEEIFQGET